MGIEVIHDHHNPISLWKMNFHQITHTLCPVDHRAPVGDFDMPPSVQGRKNMNKLLCHSARIHSHISLGPG
jgi:hypothetical protein